MKEKQYINYIKEELFQNLENITNMLYLENNNKNFITDIRNILKETNIKEILPYNKDVFLDKKNNNNINIEEIEYIKYLYNEYVNFLNLKKEHKKKFTELKLLINDEEYLKKIKIEIKNILSNLKSLNENRLKKLISENIVKDLNINEKDKELLRNLITEIIKMEQILLNKEGQIYISSKVLDKISNIYQKELELFNQKLLIEKIIDNELSNIIDENYLKLDYMYKLEIEPNYKITDLVDEINKIIRENKHLINNDIQYININKIRKVKYIIKQLEEQIKQNDNEDIKKLLEKLKEKEPYVDKVIEQININKVSFIDSIKEEIKNDLQVFDEFNVTLFEGIKNKDTKLIKQTLENIFYTTKVISDDLSKKIKAKLKSEGILKFDENKLEQKIRLEIFKKVNNEIFSSLSDTINKVFGFDKDLKNEIININNIQNINDLKNFTLKIKNLINELLIDNDSKNYFNINNQLKERYFEEKLIIEEENDERIEGSFIKNLNDMLNGKFIKTDKSIKEMLKSNLDSIVKGKFFTSSKKLKNFVRKNLKEEMQYLIPFNYETIFLDDYVNSVKKYIKENKLDRLLSPEKKAKLYFILDNYEKKLEDLATKALLSNNSENKYKKEAEKMIKEIENILYNSNEYLQNIKSIKKEIINELKKKKTEIDYIKVFNNEINVQILVKLPKIIDELNNSFLLKLDKNASKESLILEIKTHIKNSLLENKNEFKKYLKEYLKKISPVIREEGDIRIGGGGVINLNDLKLFNLNEEEIINNIINEIWENYEKNIFPFLLNDITEEIISELEIDKSAKWNTKIENIIQNSMSLNEAIKNVKIQMKKTNNEKELNELKEIEKKLKLLQKENVNFKKEIKKIIKIDNKELKKYKFLRDFNNDLETVLNDTYNIIYLEINKKILKTNSEITDTEIMSIIEKVFSWQKEQIENIIKYGFEQVKNAKIDKEEKKEILSKLKKLDQDFRHMILFFNKKIREKEYEYEYYKLNKLIEIKEEITSNLILDIDNIKTINNIKKMIQDINDTKLKKELKELIEKFENNELTAKNMIKKINELKNKQEEILKNIQLFNRKEEQLRSISKKYSHIFRSKFLNLVQNNLYLSNTLRNKIGLDFISKGINNIVTNIEKENFNYILPLGHSKSLKQINKKIKNSGYNNKLLNYEKIQEIDKLKNSFEYKFLFELVKHKIETKYPNVKLEDELRISEDIFNDLIWKNITKEFDENEFKEFNQKLIKKVEQQLKKYVPDELSVQDDLKFANEIFHDIKSEIEDYIKNKFEKIEKNKFNFIMKNFQNKFENTILAAINKNIYSEYIKIKTIKKLENGKEQIDYISSRKILNNLSKNEININKEIESLFQETNRLNRYISNLIIKEYIKTNEFDLKKILNIQEIEYIEHINILQKFELKHLFDAENLLDFKINVPLVIRYKDKNNQIKELHKIITLNINKLEFLDRLEDLTKGLYNTLKNQTTFTEFLKKYFQIDINNYIDNEEELLEILKSKINKNNARDIMKILENNIYDDLQNDNYSIIYELKKYILNILKNSEEQTEENNTKSKYKFEELKNIIYKYIAENYFNELNIEHYSNLKEIKTFDKIMNTKISEITELKEILSNEELKNLKNKTIYQFLLENLSNNEVNNIIKNLKNKFYLLSNTYDYLTNDIASYKDNFYLLAKQIEITKNIVEQGNEKLQNIYKKINPEAVQIDLKNTIIYRTSPDGNKKIVINFYDPKVRNFYNKTLFINDLIKKEKVLNKYLDKNNIQRLNYLIDKYKYAKNKILKDEINNEIQNLVENLSYIKGDNKKTGFEKQLILQYKKILNSKSSTEKEQYLNVFKETYFIKFLLNLNGEIIKNLDIEENFNYEKYLLNKKIYINDKLDGLLKNNNFKNYDEVKKEIQKYENEFEIINTLEIINNNSFKPKKFLEILDNNSKNEIVYTSLSILTLINKTLYNQEMSNLKYFEVLIKNKKTLENLLISITKNNIGKEKELTELEKVNKEILKELHELTPKFSEIFSNKEIIYYKNYIKSNKDILLKKLRGINYMKVFQIQSILSNDENNIYKENLNIFKDLKIKNIFNEKMLKTVNNEVLKTIKDKYNIDEKEIIKKLNKIKNLSYFDLLENKNLDEIDIIIVEILKKIVKNETYNLNEKIYNNLLFNNFDYQEEIKEKFKIYYEQNSSLNNFIEYFKYSIKNRESIANKITDKKNIKEYILNKINFYEDFFMDLYNSSQIFELEKNRNYKIIEFNKYYLKLLKIIKEDVKNEKFNYLNVKEITKIIEIFDSWLYLLQKNDFSNKEKLPFILSSVNHLIRNIDPELKKKIITILKNSGIDIKNENDLNKLLDISIENINNEHIEIEQGKVSIIHSTGLKELLTSNNLEKIPEEEIEEIIIQDINNYRIYKLFKNDLPEKFNKVNEIQNLLKKDEKLQYKKIKKGESDILTSSLKNLKYNQKINEERINTIKKTLEQIENTNIELFFINDKGQKELKLINLKDIFDNKTGKGINLENLINNISNIRLNKEILKKSKEELKLKGISEEHPFYEEYLLNIYQDNLMKKLEDLKNIQNISPEQKIKELEEYEKNIEVINKIKNSPIKEQIRIYIDQYKLLKSELEKENKIKQKIKNVYNSEIIKEIMNESSGLNKKIAETLSFIEIYKTKYQNNPNKLKFIEHIETEMNELFEKYDVTNINERKTFEDRLIKLIEQVDKLKFREGIKEGTENTLQKTGNILKDGVNSVFANTGLGDAFMLSSILEGINIGLNKNKYEGYNNKRTNFSKIKELLGMKEQNNASIEEQVEEILKSKINNSNQSQVLSM